VTITTSPTNSDSNSSRTNPTFQIIMEVLGGCLVFIVLFLALNFGYTKFTSGGSSFPVTSITKAITKSSPV
jgi:hypothetical protein